MLPLFELPSWLGDMALNLIAEGFGILITVFFVDRLIQRREKQRWQSSRNLIYGSLLTLMGGLLRHLLPRGLYESSPGEFYYYGDTSAHPNILISEDLKELFTDEFYSRYFLEKLEIPILNGFMLAELVNAQSEVRVFLNLISTADDPQLLRGLLDLYQALTILPVLKPFATEGNNIELVRDILHALLKLRFYLEECVTSKNSLESMYKDLQVTREDYEISRERERKLIERPEKGER